MGRKALRQRRKPRRSRRRHPQRTLRIRHGFASFGRYYFAPEKKINTKKVWILSGDKSFSVWKGGGGGGMAGVMQSRCAPRRRAARGPGWGGGAVIRLDPPPAPWPPTAPSFPVSACPPILVSSSYLILRGYRGLLSSWDCDFTRILQLGVVRRSASLCPSGRDLRLGSFRWVFDPQWLWFSGIRLASHGLFWRESGELQ